MFRIIGVRLWRGSFNLLNRCSTLSRKMETNADIETAFRKLIQDNTVMVFSKTFCPYCNKTKSLFEEINQQYHAYELDLQPADKCSQMQDVLKEMTGQRSVPNVFINGVHVGGNSDTQQALADGTLFDRLENIYQKYDYDYIVIGGGSGGLASSKEAAKLGKTVAVCDLVQPSPHGTSWGLGGTCVNVGCIPKKLMHKASIIGEDIEDAPFFGWTFGDSKEHNWETMVENIQSYIKSLNWKYRKSLKDQKVTYLNNYAKFKNKHTLALLDKQGKEVKEVTAQNFLLAMGCRPSYPQFPGVEHCISSDDIFSMNESPGKTLIIGASYIALETAGFLRGLGLDVTIMVRSILLRGFDQEIANMIGKNMENHGIKFWRQCVPISVTKTNDNELVVVGRKSESDSKVTLYEETFKTVFLAVGREACTKNMGLEALGVNLNERDNRVIVNKSHQSSVRNIYAVGDIIEEKYQLTPVAIQQGKLLAQRLYGGKKTLFNYNCVPTTVFTPLEYGSVGLSEEVSQDTYGKDNVEVYHLHFQPLEWELSSRNKNEAFAKLICLKTEKERVIGFHYLGPNAGEVTQAFALGMKLNATKEDFDDLVGIHPTCAEIFTTMTITKASGQSAQQSGC